MPDHDLYNTPWRASQDRIKSLNPKVVILSGGPNSVHVEGSPRVPEGFFEWAAEAKVAVLGVCYGMQVRTPQGRRLWRPSIAQVNHHQHLAGSCPARR